MKNATGVLSAGSVAGGGTVRSSVRSSLFVLSLVLAFGASAPSAFAATVADQVDQYTVNNGTNFIRSSATQSLSTSGGTVSQTTNTGSVTVNASSATGYADSGFYTKWMKIGDLKSISVTGSGPYGVNIWLDTNSLNDNSSTNGNFFTWINQSYTTFGSYNEDKSMLGPSSNGALTINGTSLFNGTIGVGAYGPHTLAELKASYPTDTKIAFWVGTTVASGGTQSATISAFDVVLSGELAAQDFGVWNTSGVIGYSAGFNLTDANFTGASSIVVKLFAANDQLLQTNTAVAGKFDGLTQISSPFDVFGTFYGNSGTDGYWNSVKEAEYGQNLVPTKVVATVTLANGKIITAENTNLTGGNLTLLGGTLAAQDFGVWNESLVKGYSTGLKLTDATFTGATVVVKLYSGDTLLQTNTATTTGFAGLTQISSPFDVFGTFPYVTDGYWTNVREAEYGQTLVPTKVVATVTLANGKVITVENTNLTGDLTIILASAKTSAHLVLTTALGTYVQANYTADNWTTLTGFKKAGDTAIDAATTLAGVATAQSDATTGMAGVAKIVIVSSAPGRSGSHRSSNAATPAVPATPAIPGVSPAVPATPSINSNGNANGRVLGASTFNFTRDLGVGLSGADVTALQQILIDAGVLKINAPTGNFGQLTKAAVQAFQKAHSVSQTGFVGPLTRGELNKGVTPTATNLTSVQADAILSLLESFGADASVVAKVRASLGR